MAETPQNAVRPRPLSPHLTIWWPTITYVMSISHRITGAGLYFGMALLAWWLLAAASGPGAFDIASAVFGSWIGLVVLAGFTWALVHHLLGGIRHLIWDTGVGYSKTMRNGLAWATIFGSVSITVILWAVGLALR